LLSLTLSAFNLTKNEIKFKSLTKDYFQQQQLENFKGNSKQPHERLSDIFDGKENVKMLTQPFILRAIIPKKVEEAISINAVAEFTNKITKYSELISNSKKMSAESSILSLLSKREVHMKNMKENNDDFVVILIASFYTQRNGMNSSKICSMIKPNGIF
jgi:hypothetical protein